MTDNRPSRRALLRYCSAGVAAGLAGCLWGNSDDNPDDGESDDTPVDTATPTPTPTPTDTETDTPDLSYAEAFDLAGDGTDPFRNWVVPDNPQGKVGDVTAICAYRDFEAAAEQSVSSLTQYRSTLASEYGVDAESFSGELLVGQPDGSGTRLIQFGDFDLGALLRTFRDSDIMSFTGEYRGYSVFEQRDGNTIVVGSDAVIRVPIYEQYIDASKGDADRLTDVDEDVRHLFSVLPAGLQISVSRHENLSDLVINGSTRHDLKEDGTPNRTTRAFVFDEEGNATVDRAKEIISTGSSDYEEILTTEQHRRMVMVEFIADWTTEE